ncbi:hypothetical protein A5658_04845 [Mycobacterium sp. 1245111.1]|uniref:hypothetical protein n=1 Tax=Mycobacterium sp. 1245111.1 TaxID=1834073 RepID=UPI0007FCF72A|nr:hypothetical protein [Mycobacterium sp. 1245111.1]OBK36988.1 hypothetical protein A5658_04845 [Mycobacterium sp. 1245111.1]
MSNGRITRQKVLTRADEGHPVSGLIDQAEGRAASTQAPAPTAAPRPAPAPTAAARPAPAPAHPDAGAGATAKKQVNYRLDPVLIEDLKQASIVHSFRQRRQISQNQIVETAVREWLDNNGPWEI